MQVSICWFSLHDLECLTPRFEQRVEAIGNIHGLDCPARRWQGPLSFHTVPCYPRPLSGATVTVHGAQCCGISLNDGNSAVAAYWAVFLSRQPPEGAAVAAHTVMMSHRAAVVSVVDVVKFFVI